MLISAALVSLVLGAAALALAWRSHETALDAARRTAEGYAYESAVGSQLYLQGRLDLLDVYGTRAAFVLADPVSASLEIGAVPTSAGFDAGVLWYDESGRLRAGARGEPETDPVLLDQIDRVLSTGTPRVTPVVESPELAGRAVVLLVPTHGGDGQPNGVLAGAISSAWLSEQAARQGELRGTQTFIFDDRGTAIAAPPGASIVAPPLPVPASGADRGAVALRAATNVRDPLGRGHHTIGLATEHRLTGWTIAEVQPDSVALGPARRSFERSAVAVGMFVLAVMLGAAVAARRSNALHRRARAAEDRVLQSAERERAIATTLQESLLPRRAPAVPGLEVVARYRPAGPDVVVGGDFYDVAELGNGRWQVIVGDVCGHGVSAAAATSLARHTLRVAGRHTSGPAEWLRWLHKELASLDGDDFVTAVAMEVSVSDALVRVRLAVAGHPLPILLRGNGEVGTVGHPGTLLGVVAPTVVEDEVWLGPGDRLVVYTDGLTDSWLPRLRDDDILELVGTNQHLDITALADALLAAAAPAATAPYDDTAVLVLGVPATSTVAGSQHQPTAEIVAATGPGTPAGR